MDDENEVRDVDGSSAADASMGNTVFFEQDVRLQGPAELGRRSLRPAGEQGEGVRQAPVPRRRGDAAR